MRPQNDCKMFEARTSPKCPRANSTSGAALLVLLCCCGVELLERSCYGCSIVLFEETCWTSAPLNVPGPHTPDERMKPSRALGQRSPSLRDRQQFSGRETEGAANLQQRERDSSRLLVACLWFPLYNEVKSGGKAGFSAGFLSQLAA